MLCEVPLLFFRRSGHNRVLKYGLHSSSPCIRTSIGAVLTENKRGQDMNIRIKTFCVLMCFAGTTAMAGTFNVVDCVVRESMPFVGTVYKHKTYLFRSEAFQLSAVADGALLIQGQKLTREKIAVASRECVDRYYYFSYRLTPADVSAPPTRISHDVVTEQGYDIYGNPIVIRRVVTTTQPSESLPRPVLELSDVVYSKSRGWNAYNFSEPSMTTVYCDVGSQVRHNLDETRAIDALGEYLVGRRQDDNLRMDVAAESHMITDRGCLFISDSPN